jgi:uncharacterized protein
MKQFLLQMAGEPGTGKSTLATAIGRAIDAVVLDKDVIKSRILDGDKDLPLAGLSESIAAPLAYAVFFDLAAVLTVQGFSVVMDSPAFYPIIRTRGRAIAEAARASYFIIDCHLPDLDILQARIDSKVLSSSQPSVASIRGFDRPGTKPLTEPHLRIDTRRPLEECLADALAYIGRDHE